MLKKILIAGFLVYFLLFFRASFALAAPAPDCPTYCSDHESYDPPVGKFCFCNPWEAKDLEELIQNLIRLIFWLATALFPVFILIGAFFIMASSGNPERINTGKRIMIYAAFGYGIVVFANALVYIIKDVIGGPPPPAP